MKHIVIPMGSLKYFDRFAKNFNALGAETDALITFLVDDRHSTTLDEFRNIIQSTDLPLYDIIAVSEILNKIKHDFDDCPLFEPILDVYGVSIKSLMFYYVLKHLEYDKFFFLDDDVIVARVPNHIWDYDYAIKTDMALDKGGNGFGPVMESVYGKDMFIEWAGQDHKNRDWRINSGSLLYTVRDDSADNLLDHIKQFFSSKAAYDTLEAARKRMIKKGLSYVPGNVWVNEQHILGMFLHKYHLNDNVYRLKQNDVYIGGMKSELTTTKPFRTIPCIYHPCCRSSEKKIIFIDHFLKRMRLSV